MGTAFVDNIREHTLGHGVHIPGHVIDIVSTTKTDTFTSGSETFTDITGLSATITPKSAQNKIYVMFTVYFSMTATGWGGMVQLNRGSTPICVGDSAGTRIQSSGSFYMTGNIQFINSVSNNFLDSPNTTSTTTYKLLGRTQASSYGFYINRNHGDADSDSIPRLASTLTLMEIAQ